MREDLAFDPAGGVYVAVMSDEGIVEQKIYQERCLKSEEWRKLGHNPFGNGFRPTHLAGELVAKYSGVTQEQLEADKPGHFSIAGRIVSQRDFGKAAFIVVSDRSGSIQVHFKRDVLGDKYAAFKLVDVADFVGITGTLFRSKTGELTIAAGDLIPFTKSLRPLP